MCHALQSSKGYSQESVWSKRNTQKDPSFLTSGCVRNLPPVVKKEEKRNGQYVKYQ